jgi:hypothetical protein
MPASFFYGEIGMPAAQAAVMIGKQDCKGKLQFPTSESLMTHLYAGRLSNPKWWLELHKAYELQLGLQI